MRKKLEITPNVETLFGTRDENLHIMEDGLGVSINLHSDSVGIEGTAENVARAEQIFLDFEHLRKAGHVFHNGDLGNILRVMMADKASTLRGLAEAAKSRSQGVKRMVQPKSVNQRKYLDMIANHDMVFGVGPAGTGKTYLAVAMAVSALQAKQVGRIILARPAVEAGERLG